MNAPEPLLLRADADGVATLTLNRPAARNSLSLAMLQSLQAALAEIARNESVRCLVLAAAGPVYCAGHDLRELTAHRADPDGGRGFFEECMARCAAVMQAVVALPQPVIAAVQGVATAAGCQLAASCDLVVASETAHFCTPGVDIGLFCSTPAVALTRAIGPKPAMEMLLTGEMIDAEEARRLGLVNRVVPPVWLMEEAQALGERIASRSTIAVQMGKRTVRTQQGMELEKAYAHCAAAMVENLLAEDAAEGIDAFLGKRTPTWRNR
jgi:enoyl-CoA hydratase/carnithine racemase